MVAVPKQRGLFEGPEWEESWRAIEPDAKRRDEAFRFFSYNIAVAPRTNTTPFLSQDHRILVSQISYTAQLWVYFRIEPDDDNCTLLWAQIRRHDIGLQPG